MSADRIKKVIIAVAMVCLVVWLAMMLKLLAVVPTRYPPA
jgi:hypothetical protein